MSEPGRYETVTAGPGRPAPPEDPAAWEVRFIEAAGVGTPGGHLEPGTPKRLDRLVTRVLAPNPGPLTGPGTNTYLVGEREVAVIDPGPADAAHVAAVLAAGAGRIRQILCTHTHADHCSAAPALARATGAPILGQPAAAAGRDVPVVFDRILAEGERVVLEGVTLAVIHTPGHASNHLCFLLEDTGMLFCGDHIVQGSTVVIPPPDGNMRDYLSSLRRLAALDPAVLAPGHGFLMGEPRAQAERLLRHRLAREEKVRQGLKAEGGSATLEALLTRVYDDVPTGLHALAACSLQAHLDKLLEDGELSRAADRYTLV